MHKIKFIQIIFILFILVFPKSSQAKTENIELYFFYSPTCPACHQAEILLGTLKTKYPNLRIRRFEIFKENNQKLYSALAKIYQIDHTSVPGIFIEKKGFNYCSFSTISEIEKIILRCEKQKCDSPTQKLLANTTKKETSSPKSNLNIIYIIVSIIILGFLSIKIFTRKRKNLIH